MTDKEIIWNKYIGHLTTESLCYIGCGTIILQHTFINFNGKPVCKVCANNLQLMDINEFKAHYKLITPECYLNISEEITSKDLFNNVVKENNVSVFSSKYGYKYALHLLLTLFHENPEIKICICGDPSMGQMQFLDDCRIWESHYGITGANNFSWYQGISQLTINYNNNKNYSSHANQYKYDIFFHHILRVYPYDIDEIIKNKNAYDAATGKQTCLIITYDNDYYADAKTTFLNAATNYISVGLEDKTIVAIIDKVNSKACDKKLRYNYLKLFGGQKLVGAEIS